MEHACMNDTVDNSFFRWPNHIAANMADHIHNQVRDMLRNSRLTRKTDHIRLVGPEDIAHVEKLLGSGAFSQVTSVITQDGNRYACKHLKPDLMANPDQFRTAASELAYEAHMLAAFDHPNILKIHGWARNGIASFEDGRHNSFFLLLDMLDETLDQRIDRWTREELQLMHQMNATNHHRQSRPVRMINYDLYISKLQTIKEIASALDYIHSCGVIFRDLKPNNIGFLGSQAKLFDFGLSRELPALDTTVPFKMSGRVGTIRYMAPEVVMHEPYNIPADVYSWSMVAYEMLTLDKPYSGWTPEMHADFVCRRGLRPDTNKLQSDMLILLQHAWHMDPSRRPRFGHIGVQIHLFQEKQRLLWEEKQLQRQLSRQFNVQGQQQLQQGGQVHHGRDLPKSRFSQRYSRKIFRSHSCESLETIETSSLSAESLGW